MEKKSKLFYEITKKELGEKLGIKEKITNVRTSTVIDMVIIHIEDKEE